MILTPFILAGAICNALYCMVKIVQDFRGERAAMGLVGLVGVISGTALSVIAIATVLLTSKGDLT